MQTIKLEKLPDLFAVLAETGTLYLPIADGPVVLFKPWEKGAEVRLDAVNTAVPPKDLFLPREETFLHYRCSGQFLELNEIEGDAGKPAIAFGIHPCDLKALEMLDRVYIDQEPGDELYRKRRNNTTVVALACNAPDPYCFCRVFDVDPGLAPGADVMARLIGDALYLEAQSAKGRDLLAHAGELLDEADKKQVSPVPVETADFGLQLDNLAAELKNRFEDPAWDSLYRSCLGCGVCTYVCPTCYCFDVEDFGHETRGERFRCWDSCMYSQFTVMAGGHNPRPGRKERVRQRFLHKLQYYPELYGETACVGCGRCLRSCPVNLDIVQAIKALGGVQVEQC